MAPQFPSYYPQEGPVFLGPSDAVPFGQTQSYPGNYQAYMHPELNMFAPIREHSEMTIVNVASLEPPFLTGPPFGPDLVGDNGAASTFQPYFQPDGYYGCQAMMSLYPIRPLFGTAESPYPDNDNHREVPIASTSSGPEIIFVNGMDSPIPAQDTPSFIPSTYTPNSAPPILPAQHSTRYHVATPNPSESTSDALGSASPTVLPAPHTGKASLSTKYHTFIDDHPFLNKFYDLAKRKVGSLPILQASNARRMNPAPFVCQFCEASFTRFHNLSYHWDAHLGIKRHIALCGKKFGTPYGSKRHEVKCPKCQGVSNSSPSLG